MGKDKVTYKAGKILNISPSGEKTMKENERKLLSELLKNSRRTDRELAKAIGMSQPTVSRLMKKLGKEGYIKEYTIIPSFTKLGYRILAFTIIKLSRSLAADDIGKARKAALESIEKGPFEMVLAERGMGLESNGILVSIHENYASYTKLKNWLRQLTFLQIDITQSFLVDLKDTVHYRPFTFSTLAKHLLALGKQEAKPT